MPAAPAIGFAILFVPLFDTLRIFSFRILRRRSPFSPDRNHIHHLLLDKGCSHPVVTAIAVLFNLVVILLTYTARFLGNTILLIGLVTMGFVVIGLLFYSGNKKRKMMSSLKNDASLPNDDLKVINLQSPASPPDLKDVAN
jgi:amino acid transporter